MASASDDLKTKHPTVKLSINILMAVIEISEIKIRRGLETELLPTSLGPGEFGMALDTGRLFLGTDPAFTGLWTGRAISPYTNIEVLTESSVDTFARLYDRMHRTTGPVGITEGDLARKPYLNASLAPAVTWTSVQVERINAATGLYDSGILEDVVLCETVSVGAHINYFLFNGTNLVRSGVLVVNHDGNLTIDEAQLVDQTTARYESAASSISVSADTAFLTGVRFRAMRLAAGPSGHLIRLEYQNSTSTTYTVELRLMVAAIIPTP